jgi:eukaryotic-like serine/threonine-protein kinase
MSATNRRPSQDTALSQLGESRLEIDLTGVTLGDFRVESLLGRGGMGEVYLANQTSLNRPVALKVLRPDLAANPTYLGRLKSEATAVAKLNHPNIVHVYTLGCIDNINFIAMEYVQGTNLRDYIYKKGALDLALALSIIRQTGQAIAAAGEVGLIHRDVKPENILMTKKGRVKVADFGLCRDQDQPGLHLTQPGVTMGTPLYMSPEQAQGHPVDHRSDLYSLGVTAYHMLAGVPPFEAETALALALKQVKETPRSMLVHRPDLPPELDRLVLKLMAKSPADRYQSATLMLLDLAKIRETLPAGATATFVDASTGTSARPSQSFSPGAGTGSVAEKQPGDEADEALSEQATAGGYAPWRALGRLNWGVMAAVSFACLLVGAFAGWGSRSPDVAALAADATAPPVLWLDPTWSEVPKEPSADLQLRYALFQAPREQWVAAFLAVPGYFPRAHDSCSKAYTQTARIWHRRCDVQSLRALEADLGRWKEAQKHDRELAQIVRISINLRNDDFDAVVEQMKTLTKDEVSDIYDRALVELSLEVCADAIVAASRSGTETLLRDALQQCQRKLARRLFDIEAEAPRAGARAAAKAAEKQALRLKNNAKKQESGQPK